MKKTMFSGIIQLFTAVESVERKTDFVRLGFKHKEWTSDLQKGASVSISGVCLTVAEITRETIYFDVMKETLVKTTLGELEKGSLVNIERSVKVGDEIGGHPVSGHVHTTAKIISIKQPENNFVITLSPKEPKWMDYILEKGFIALDGASLTVVDVNKEDNTFTVWLIPETLSITTFGSKKTGEYLNLECDQQTVTIVETIERILKHRNI